MIGELRRAAPLDQALDAVRTEGLSKSFGALRAVERLDLEIPQGRFFGLLGPNGSGKTTTIHMLATLIRPTAGTAVVAGHDVRAEPVAVRRAIGLVFQESALDRSLTVEENLQLTAALHDLPPRQARGRIDELLALFGLAEKRRAPVGSLSGGMRRALDIIRGILHRPRVLFLDEPTIGLDVLNRRAIWRYIERLRQQEAITVLLTTHYLEEAEGCDRVAFLSRGRLIGSGTPQQLIRALGAYVLELEGGAQEAISTHLMPQLGAPLQDGDRLSFRIPSEDFPLEELHRELRSRVRNLRIHRPDLNDVYVWLNSGMWDGSR